MRTISTLLFLSLVLLAPLAAAQVVSTLPQATGGNPVGEWKADSTGYQVYVPPDLASLNLTFSGRLNGRFTVRADSTYTANYIAAAKGSANLGLIKVPFDVADTVRTTGQYSIRGGTRMIVRGLDSPTSVDTLSFSVKGDSLMLQLPLVDPRLTAFGIRLTLLLPFARATVASGVSADFNGSGRVDFDDFFLLAETFGKGRGEAGFNAKCDLSADGTINFDDFFIFAERFGGSG